MGISLAEAMVANIISQKVQKAEKKTLGEIERIMEIN